MRDSRCSSTARLSSQFPSPSFSSNHVPPFSASLRAHPFGKDEQCNGVTQSEVSLIEVNPRGHCYTRYSFSHKLNCLCFTGKIAKAEERHRGDGARRIPEDGTSQERSTTFRAVPNGASTRAGSSNRSVTLPLTLAVAKIESLLRAGEVTRSKFRGPLFDLYRRRMRAIDLRGR